MESKKLSLFTVTCMNIGVIVGAGIFSSLVESCTFAGAAIVLAIAVAIVEVIVRYLPSIIPSASIPASSGFYMYMARLVNPFAGYLIVIKFIFNICIVAMLASTFATYFCAMVPVNPMLVKIIVLILFTITACCGLQISSWIQNVMVCLLMVGLLTFFLTGVGHINPEYFTIGKAFDIPAVGLSSFGAAIAMMATSLAGGTSAAFIAEDIKNPARNVILSFILSTGIVGILYILMSAVTVGCADVTQISSLAEIAKANMSGALYNLFMVLGALMAIATTIHGNLYSAAASMEPIAKDKVFPAFFLKKNKFGMCPAAVIALSLPAMVLVVFGISVGTLMRVSSIVAIVIGVCQFIPVLKLPKKYPHSYRHAPIKFSRPLLYAIMGVSLAFCVYEAYSLLVTTSTAAWITLAGALVVFFGYFFIRKAYLQKQGVDLYALMSAPYEPWEKQEAKYRQMDEAER
ncbi:APC family permease [Hominifimenecus sp. rT4P-3]|uniref:APC family permease n=1 Tax=Hominifimenecus sp. rT4P-3 TaxID=3242979 RepID=UPI003DA4AB84